MLGCANSRVAPELAFDQGPGEVFVVRLAGNFVNDDGLASLEYGVRFLGVPLIMVLGHSNCGAVDATIKVLKDNARLPGHLPELVRSIEPAVEAARKANASNLLDRGRSRAKCGTNLSGGTDRFRGLIAARSGWWAASTISRPGW